MNKLLKRQIAKALGSLEDTSDEVRKLLQLVGDTYDHFEKERKILEHTIAVSSRELVEVNEKLLRETAELRKSELLLRSTQQIAKVGSWEFSVVERNYAAGELQWSNETYSIFGCDKNCTTTTMQLFFERVHPDDRQRVNKAVFKSLRTCSPYILRHRLILPDGTEKIVLERAEVISDPLTGRPLKMQGTVQDVTEIEKSDEALRKANTELGLLFENMQEVFFSVDTRTGDLIQMSEACKKIYGRTVEEFKENSNLWFEVVLEEDKPVIMSNYEVMNRGESFTQEYRVFHSDGSLRWLETRVTPTLDHNGALVRIDGITCDITGRKQAEADLRTSERKSRALIENGADAILIVNERIEVTFASNNVERITGYTPAEMVGLNASSFVHEDYIETLRKNHEWARNHPGVPSTIVVRRFRKDGTSIWCEGTATSLLHDPAVRGVVVNFRDITTRKDYEDALKFSEHRFRALIENSSEAIIVTDSDLNITYVSNSLERVAGYKPVDILGKEMLTLANAGEKEMLRKFLAGVKGNPGRPFKLTYRTTRKDGSYMWCERVTINLLEDPSIHGIVSNFSDVTERLEAERALQTSNEELKKSNQELDKFVYSVSHDLRAPLTSLLGLIEITKTEDSVEEMMSNLEHMKTSVNKLDGFIKDILDYSKNSRLEPQKEKIDFRGLLDEVVGNLRFMGDRGKDIDIRIDIENESDFYSDRHRIGVIMTNLVSNAIRYANPAEEKPFVSITARLTRKNAYIGVEDNGIGIKPEHHEKVFDMFFRSASTSVGSGLGLYIVRETMKKIRGMISLESTLGKGSRFELTIPNSIIKKHKKTEACLTR